MAKNNVTHSSADRNSLLMISYFSILNQTYWFLPHWNGLLIAWLAFIWMMAIHFDHICFYKLISWQQRAIFYGITLLILFGWSKVLKMLAQSYEFSLGLLRFNSLSLPSEGWNWTFNVIDEVRITSEMISC